MHIRSYMCRQKEREREKEKMRKRERAERDRDRDRETETETQRHRERERDISAMQFWNALEVFCKSLRRANESKKRKDSVT